MLQVRQLIDKISWTFTYLLYDFSSLQAALIDPVLDNLQRDLNYIKKLNLNLLYIFETHVHADHITGAHDLRLNTKAKIHYGSKSGVHGADRLLNDGDEIELGKYRIRAIFTPGHTSGCVSYYIENYLFTGDSLFIDGSGRTDLQGGSAATLYESINKLFKLPDETIVFPAHNYDGFTKSTIGEEKKNNSSINLNVSKAEFIKTENKRNRPYPKQIDRALPANINCGRIP